MPYKCERIIIFIRYEYLISYNPKLFVLRIVYKRLL